MGLQVCDFVGDAAVEVGDESILAGRADQHILDAVVDDASSYDLSFSDGTVSSTASTVTIGTFTPLTQGVRVINDTLYIIGTPGRDHVNLKFD